MHELIRRRHNIIGRGKSQRAFWELSWQIVFLIERISEFTFIIIAPTSPSMCIVTREEPVFIEVCSCLCTHTCSKPVNEVRSKHCVDRTYIYLAGMIHIACFYKVFDQCFACKQNILKAIKLFDSMDKGRHSVFTLREFYRAILIPKGFIAHHSIGFSSRRSLAFEELFGQFVEGIIT